MRPTEPFRQEHEHLIEHIEHLAQAAREMPRLSEEERDLLRARILAFLRETLIPHAKAEEEILYPAWATLVGYSDAAIPMVHDHEAIVALVDHQRAARRPANRAHRTGGRAVRLVRAGHGDRGAL
jgi:hemerythrin superfamily protein